MLRLKVNYQKQRTGKESMEMFMQHFKVGEVDYYIFEEEIIFRAVHVPNRNLIKAVKKP